MNGYVFRVVGHLLFNITLSAGHFLGVSHYRPMDTSVGRNGVAERLFLGGKLILVENSNLLTGGFSALQHYDI